MFQYKACRVFRAAFLAAAGPLLVIAQQPGVRPLAVAGSTIDQSGSYMLTSALPASNVDTAITITASGVTLDLNGQELMCAGNLRGVGLRISGAQNVAVRNGNIANCAMGVVVMDSANVTLEGLRIRGMGIAVNAPPPEIGIMLMRSRNVVVRGNQIYNEGLGIFVRGSASYGNRIEGNSITSAMNGALGICYNPADNDPNGPKGDLVTGNVIRGFPTAISVTKTADYNVFRGNTLFFFKSAFESENSSNLEMDNTKVKLEGK